MGIFHYLNVKNGDCTIIQHPSGHVSVIDVCNASKEDKKSLDNLQVLIRSIQTETLSAQGNYNQKAYPVNPIEYLKSFSVSEIFRFILTHPDMDHLSGINDLFDAFNPTNFWDTDNDCEKDDFENSPYNENDWTFYKSIRDGLSKVKTKRLVLYSNSKGQYYNQGEDGSKGGDGIYILSPTKKIVEDANKSEEYNDLSYVILYKSSGGKILLSGDSTDVTWKYILENHKEDIKNVDLLLAPHHGRDSGMSFDFLDIVNPAMTFFGNASSDHLAYSTWNNKKLPFITNNQANCMVVDTNCKPMKLYVTNKKFAEKENPNTLYSSKFKAYYLQDIVRK